jgi:hypothetical protein
VRRRRWVRGRYRLQQCREFSSLKCRLSVDERPAASRGVSDEKKHPCISWGRRPRAVVETTVSDDVDEDDGKSDLSSAVEKDFKWVADSMGRCCKVDREKLALWEEWLDKEGDEELWELIESKVRSGMTGSLGFLVEN